MLVYRSSLLIIQDKQEECYWRAKTQEVGGTSQPATHVMEDKKAVRAFVAATIAPAYMAAWFGEDAAEA